MQACFSTSAWGRCKVKKDTHPGRPRLVSAGRGRRWLRRYFGSFRTAPIRLGTNNLDLKGRLFAVVKGLRRKQFDRGNGGPETDIRPVSKWKR